MTPHPYITDALPAMFALPVTYREDMDSVAGMVLDLIVNSTEAGFDFPEYLTFQRMYLYEAIHGSRQDFSAVLVVPLGVLRNIDGWRLGKIHRDCWNDQTVAVFAVTPDKKLLYHLDEMKEAIDARASACVELDKCATDWLSGRNLYGTWKLVKRICAGGGSFPLLAQCNKYSLPEHIINLVENNYRRVFTKPAGEWVNLVPGGLNGVVRAIRRIEEMLVYSAFNAFLEKFNSSVIKELLDQRGQVEPMEYNWLAASSNRKIGKYRLDALRVLPAISVNLCFPIFLPVDAGKKSPSANELSRQSINATIDEGMPLIAKLASEFGVSKATIRNFLDVPPEWSPVLVDPLGGIRQLVRWVGSLPPERFPRGRENWEMFGYMVREAYAVADALPKAARQARRIYLEESVSKWLVRISRLGFVAAAEQFRRRFHGVSSLADAKDMVSVLLRMNEIDEISNTCLIEVSTMLAGYSPAEWQKFSNTWHARLHVERKAVSIEDEILSSWASIAPPMRLVNVDIMPLLSDRDLDCEGTEMHHCVGGYDIRCAFDREQVFSLRGKSWEDRSTLHVGYHPDADSHDRISIIQHRGSHNATPTKNCVAVVQLLVQWLNSDEATGFILHAEEERRKRKELSIPHMRGSKNFIAARAALLESLPADVICRLREAFSSNSA